MGGSKGARSINRALLPVLPDLLTEMQVVHLSGHLDWPEIKAAQDKLAASMHSTSELAARYRAFPYLHEKMGAALTAADLALARAGASTLGEFPLFGLPAILVPYPHAWRYQYVNAQYLVQHGAAEILIDVDRPEKLLSTVQGVMRDQERREKMCRAMRSLARPTAAQDISHLLKNLAADQSQERK
jgi:UDP-N-acetylglucosamine--N-acetylmuramyl-(pentapeptide) pyrophosphoryl-undecaprenol N-acetylglucosamine transferase